MTPCQAQHRRATGVRRVSRPAWSPPGRAGRCDRWGKGRPVCDVPESERHEQPTVPPVGVSEGGRLTVPGRRSDDGRRCVLVVADEADGLWSFRGPVEPGVRVTRDIVVALAEAILRRAR